MMSISHINPDVELCDFLKGKITLPIPGSAETEDVAIYSDWEHSTNNLPDDFIICSLNGDISGVGMDTPFAQGYIMVTIYCKLNDNGSIKKNRINYIISQFDSLIEKKCTEIFFFEYDNDRFITPTTPNESNGYSITSLNLRWTTTSNFNKQS